MKKSLFRGKRKLLLYAVVALMVLPFSACGTPPPSAEGTAGTSEATPGTASEGNEPVKLTVWLAGTGEAIFDQAYRKILDNYTASKPHVSYELTFISWAEYFTKLNTGLVGGAGPDIFMSGYGQMGTLQANGSLLALDGYIPDDWDGYSDFYENMLKVCKGSDGKIYGLFSPATRSFMYRKDIAAQNGVTEAELNVKTQEDLFNLARKLTVRNASGNVQTCGLEIDPDSEQTFFVYSAQVSEKPYYLWNDDLTGNINSEEGVRAMQNLYELHKEGVVSLMDPGAQISGLAQGTAAMTMGPDSYYASAEAAFPGQIGVVKSETNTLLIGNFIVVNAASKRPADVADVLIDMFSKDSCQTLAQIVSQYSGRESLDAAFVELNPDFENLVYSYQKSYPYSFALNPKYTECVTAFRTSLDAIFQGADVKSTLEAAEEAWNSTVKN